MGLSVQVSFAAPGALAAPPLDVPIGPDAKVLVFLNEKPQLVAQVGVFLVVGRGGQQDHARLVGVNVLLDGPVALAATVAQVVAFVNDERAMGRHVGQLLDHLAQRQDFGMQTIFPPVAVPHRLKLGRADDERAAAVVFLERLGHGGGHHGLAQTDYVRQQNSAMTVQLAADEPHGLVLVVE